MSVALFEHDADLDSRQFDECERVIERGKRTFLEVGTALTAIKNLGLRELRRRGYNGFQDYVRRRWEWSEQRAYQLIEAAAAVEHLKESTVVDSLPANESQARALTPLNDQPEAQRAVWAEAVRTTPEGKPSLPDLRRLVRERQEEVKAQRAALPPAPRPAPLMAPPARIDVADATSLPLADGAIDLVVTSPPYGLDKPYRGSADPAEGWQAFMRDWLAEAYRVARPGGRLAVNVPLDTTFGGNRPTYAQTVDAARAAGWSYRWTVVWAEGNVSKSIGRGSVDSPASPHVIAPVEMIAVFHKGDWKRVGGRLPDLEHEEWLSWTNGLWAFGGESRAWEGHPAPFPEELPRRLIKLLSFPGDVVLDPFCGSGTTPLAAWRLGREPIGFDLSADYVASARRRLAGARP